MKLPQPMLNDAHVVYERLKAVLESKQDLETLPDLIALAERAASVAKALEGVAQVKRFEIRSR